MAETLPPQRSRFPGLARLQQRLSELPTPETEDSLLFRLLVQVLVAIGIIATDVVAGSWTSVWAVPASFAGAAWSWRQRRERNIAVKFLIAIGMLVALFAFFGRLINDLGDTRLALAQLLIHLQVLHSFDLPRRKDLGYSTVIGLILIGVAGTLSQTSVFALPLVVFLAIAFPVLVLDYRSRLQLPTPEMRSAIELFSRRHSPLSPRRLGLFLAAVLALGLTVFALLPRFPGYQLRTFPVSAPIDEIEQEFDTQNGSVVNPGYNSGGETGVGEGVGQGLSPVEGAGELDPQFYYGFGDRINQNLRGQLEPKIVLRLRSQARGWARVLAFDRYTGQGWEISREDSLTEIVRPAWSYRFRLSPILAAARTREIVQTYTVVSDLPNIIPAFAEPEHLYFPTREIGTDLEGNLRSPGGLLEGLTYTVISEVPYRDRSRLQEASPVYPEAVSKYYLQIPEAIRDRVRQQAETLLAKADPPLVSPYEKALFLAQELKQGYEIQPNLPFLDDDEDLVEAFLFEHEGGYPDHFSTVLTVMLRSLGIPARLVTGFGSGEFNPFTGFYIIRNTDAYALTEVYFPGTGWLAFDPIPGHELLPPSIEDSETFKVVQQIWSWIAGWLPSPVVNFFSLLWTNLIGGAIAFILRLWRFFSSSWVGLFAGLLALTGTGFLSWLGWQQIRRWLYQRWLAKLPPMESIYRQMLQVLAEKGYRKHPAQTPLEYASSTRQTLEAAIAECIEEIARAYVRWRYAEQEPHLDYLQQQLHDLRRGMRRVSVR